MPPRGTKKHLSGDKKWECVTLWGTSGGKVRQKSANNTQNKNLQKPKQSLILENKRFTGLFLQILCVSLQSDYFPTQHLQSADIPHFKS